MLGELERQAIEVWNFCGGWAPERWPVCDVFVGVSDWDAVVQLMSHMRACIDAQE